MARSLHATGTVSGFEREMQLVARLELPGRDRSIVGQLDGGVPARRPWLVPHYLHGWLSAVHG
jgi:hypothetical protein